MIWKTYLLISIHSTSNWKLWTLTIDTHLNHSLPSNLDIREAILQLLGVIRNGNTKFEQHSFKDKKLSEDILDRIEKLGGQRGTERKIDNISTFLLRYIVYQIFLLNYPYNASYNVYRVYQQVSDLGWVDFDFAQYAERAEQLGKMSGTSKSKST